MEDKEERETRKIVLEVERRQAWWKTGGKIAKRKFLGVVGDAWWNTGRKERQVTREG